MQPKEGSICLLGLAGLAKPQDHLSTATNIILQDPQPAAMSSQDMCSVQGPHELHRNIKVE
jgi:hypothetical protein